MTKTLSHASIVLALATAIAGALACGSEEVAKDAVATEPFEWPADPGAQVEIEIAGHGVIRVALYPEMAPKTVENFTKLAREGFYDRTTFHRVLADFMIQGGDPNTKDSDPTNDGNGGPGYQIDDEINAASHLRGVLSMANNGRANTGGSQFFIVHQDAPHLDGRHTIFGRVMSGIEIVDAIAAVETDPFGRWGPKHRPIENQVIEHLIVRDSGAAESIAEAATTPDRVDAG